MSDVDAAASSPTGGDPFFGEVASCFFCCSTDAVSDVDASASSTTGVDPSFGEVASCFFCCSTDVVSDVDAAASSTTGGDPSARGAFVVELAGSSGSFTIVSLVNG